MLAWQLAIRFLKFGRVQTVLIVAGVSIAIAVQIFIGLLIGSLQKGFIDRTLGSSADVTIESAVREQPVIQEWQKIVSTARGIDGVESVSIVADGNAFAESDVAVYLRGFNLAELDSIYDITNAIVEGDMPSASREVVIGRELSEALKLAPGDTMMVTVPGGTDEVVSISGIYDLGVAQINEFWVIASLQTVQSIFNYGESITAIEIGVGDVFSADTIAQKVADSLNDDNITVSNWIDDNEDLFQALRSQDISTFMIQAAVIASVVVAIASMLAISVLQKSRQIGILKAMGIKDRSASMVFLIQGFLLGLMGAAIGIGLGLGMLYAFTTFVSDESGSSLIDFYLDWQLVLLSWGIAVVASTLAGILPARRSARLSPIEVINAG
mgnify:CR=1 FL=1